MKKIQNVIARVLQDTALTMLQGCSLALSGFEILRKSLHLCQRRHLHPELRLHGFSRGVHRHLPGVRLHGGSYGAFWTS